MAFYLVCIRIKLTEVCTYTCVFGAMYCSEWPVVVNPVLSCISWMELWLV